MWFDVESVSLGFTESSPHQIVNDAVINASPARVFEILATAEGQTEWFKDFVACRWTSDAPHGVDSTREIELKLLTVKERFLVWCPGERLTFAIYASTLPLVAAMVEDMRLSPSHGGATRLEWTVHYRPTMLMSPFHPVARAVFGQMFAESTRGLATYANAHP